MTGYDPRRMHLMAGFASSGHRVRAVCTCGYATTPRTTEDRALAALLTEHGTTHPRCVLCEHDYEGLTWLQIRNALVILTDSIDGEFLCCRNMPQTCRDGAARRQTQLDRTAFEAFGLDPPPPSLTLLKGGLGHPDPHTRLGQT